MNGELKSGYRFPFIIPVLCLCAFAVTPLHAQLESVAGPPPEYLWVARGHIEGHLALEYSPGGAFAPDSSVLAVVAGEKIALFDLARGNVRKVLKPRIPDVTDLDIQSANYLSPTRLLLLASGLMHPKGEKGPPPRTPELGFQWNTTDDSLFGKIETIGAKPGYGLPRYYPQFGYLGVSKESNVALWNPNSGRGMTVDIPGLTHRANVFEFSPDGHWLLLAQIETSGTPDPIVVQLKERKFADVLRGHEGTVLGIAFSRDSKRVATACEDGKVRVWSEGDWKLLATLRGHAGPVHSAEFSPDGNWIVSAGEDKTVRVWSAQDGKLVQTLSESQEPVLTASFSPNGEYLAASSEKTVVVWQRTASGQ